MVTANILGYLCQLHFSLAAMIHEYHPGKHPVTLARLGDILIEA